MKKSLALLSLAAVCFAGTAFAQGDDDDFGHQGEIKRVLLVSIDGMHAVDFANCANGIATANNGEPYCPVLASLGKTGIERTLDITLPGGFNVSPRLAQAVKLVPGVELVEDV